MKNSSIKKNLVLAGLGLLMAAGQATADKLDDVLSKGVIRCGIVLDFPPMGFRDGDNNPVGMDVDMCVDLAKGMKIKHKIVGLTWAERIPSLVSGKIDVAIASSSDTLERAQTVGFTIPYMKFQFQALVSKKNAGVIKTWADLKDKNVAAAIGTTYESEFLKYKEENWKDSKGKYTSFQSENESFFAVANNVVDAVIVTDTAAANAISSGKFEGVTLGPVAPFGADIVGMMTLRKEYGLIRYLNLFINRQVRSGRFQELYGKWIGGQAPDMTTPGTYY
ncbi:MAG: transporter substrate-binding domain-containing protein [Cellvibrionaceae bacterium]